MSSLVERLRVRSDRKPVYNLDDSEDDSDVAQGKSKNAETYEKIVRADVNNLDELFMLMHFLDAGKFGSLEEFQDEFKDINQEEQISRLHKMLAPHLLRRVKKDVMKELPPKRELILRVDLSSKQREYYKAILTRNYQLLARRGGAQISLINVVMELRKLCCHAFMLDGVEPQDTTEFNKQLLECSGKLNLMDKMMVKLKEQGHRVLIYTQFQHMLDLLEDYCNSKKWQYERIDGTVARAERQIRIDRFNAKNSSRFCFLLSTRAGGLGINLATADTVIIYDSDWNPHADLQAMARAHRLGQTDKVMIFRLITRGTIEERMMQMTKKKMVLEHLVVGKLKTQNIKQEELDDIIKYGSKELFADENDEAGKSRQIHYDDAAIDRLLDRDQVVDEEATLDEEEDGFLKASKVVMPIVPSRKPSRKETTIVAFIYRRGVIVAADSRTTVERRVVNNDACKIFRIGSSMVCTAAGSASACKRSIDRVEQACLRFRDRNMREPSALFASKVMLNIYKDVIVGPGCGSLIASHSETEGSILYYLDSGRLVRLRGTLFTQGTGARYAYRYLESRYHHDMTTDYAVDLAMQSIHYAALYDTCTGGTAVACKLRPFSIEVRGRSPIPERSRD